MNMCVLVILYSGYGYASPACFSEYGLAVPQDVVYTQHLDSGWNLWIAPPSYVRRYHPRYHHMRHIRYHRSYSSYHRSYRSYHRKYYNKMRRHYKRYRNYRKWRRHRKHSKRASKTKRNRY